METISLADLHAKLQGQGVSSKNHFAFRCPICSTIQSAQDLIDAGAGINFETVENKIGFSCIGRFTKAGPFKAGSEPGLGCNWTLGGLFRLHQLEVETPDGTRHPMFRPASPDEAQAHERAWHQRQRLTPATKVSR
jgi:hypothetical protein